jgi:hypothetical protein
MLEKIKQLATETRDLPGVRFWLTLMSADGELTVVGGYDDKAACDRTSHVNTTRWKDAHHMLEKEPTIVEGEVLAFIAPS